MNSETIINSSDELLTAKQEVELAQQMEAGREAIARLNAGRSLPGDKRLIRQGAAAKERFLTANYRLVAQIASVYQRSGVPKDDLFQEGFEGLNRAVDKFDWRLGFKFSTYATTWIRQSMSRYCARTRTTVTVPSARVIQMNSDMRKTDAAAVEAGVGAGEFEGLGEPGVYLACNPLSLDTAIGSDNGYGFVSADDPATEVVSSLLTADVIEVMERVLTEREFYATTRKWLPHLYPEKEASTLASIAKELGLSPESIRKIINGAMAKLREQPTLKEYHDPDDI